MEEPIPVQQGHPLCTFLTHAHKLVMYTTMLITKFSVCSLQITVCFCYANENVTQLEEKLRQGRTRCIWLSNNGMNEREDLEFNAQGGVCSQNATVFANWCGCGVRKQTNIPLTI